DARRDLQALRLVADANIVVTVLPRRRHRLDRISAIARDRARADPGKSPPRRRSGVGYLSALACRSERSFSFHENECKHDVRAGISLQPRPCRLINTPGHLQCVFSSL